jgi:ATP-dependent DNA helicase RecG
MSLVPEQMSLLDLIERPVIETLYKPDQIYESNDPALFLRLTEDDRFDRKSGRSDSRNLAVCLSAFGNGPSIHGGVLAIGIENDRTISGCKRLSESQLQTVESAGRDHCPDGRFVSRRMGALNDAGEEDFIVLIRIFYVEEKLVTLTNGEAFTREADRCRKLPDDQKQEIRINKGERSFELEPCGLNYPGEFKTPLVRQFCQIVREQRDGSDAVSDQEVLQIMHLGKNRDGVFVANNACALMFALDPQSVFPGSYIHFLRYEGTTEKTGRDYNVTKDRMITGGVLDVIKGGAALVDANLREFTEFRNGKFRSVPEYPRDAWYELIVNACVHRSYNLRNATIFVKMFDDHFVVESPGGFMPQVTPETIYGTHRPRNPFLMLVLREFGEVRCISEGTRRVRAEMQEAKLPRPEFIQETKGQTAVRALLRNDIANRSNSLDTEAYKVLGEAISFSLTPDERKIVNYVIEHGRINVSDALRILSTTYWHTAKARLTSLVSRGIMNFISKKLRDPNSYYILAKERDE